MSFAKQGGTNFTCRCLVLIPVILFLSVALLLSLSMVSVSSFHVGFSSSSLNLCCLSSRTNSMQEDKQVSHHMPGEDSKRSHIDKTWTNTERNNLLQAEETHYNGTIHEKTIDEDITKGGHMVEDNSQSQPQPTQIDQVKKEELQYAIGSVEEQIQKLRHGARNWTCRADCEPTCQGRGVFVYDLPPKFNKEILEGCNDISPWTDFCQFLSNQGKGRPVPKLGRSWYKTNQFTLEPIFHSRINNHPCRVLEEDKASLFYIPFYAGLHVHSVNFRGVSTEEKDRLGLELVHWLKTKRSWIQNQGKDHFLALGTLSWDFRRINSSWGVNFLELDEMQNPVKLIIERDPWHINDIGIPYPTSFHPRTDKDITRFQSKLRRSNRKVCVSFAGARRPKAKAKIRSILIKECMNSTLCTYLDCSSGECENPKTVMTLMMESEFCLQPRGDSPTRKSFFDSLVCGCIPVVFDPFTAYYQYPWHLPEDHSLYSVYIDEEQVKQGNVNVLSILKSIPVEKRKEMRRFIISDLMPRIVYADHKSNLVKFRDAFMISVDNLFYRVA